MQKINGMAAVSQAEGDGAGQSLIIFDDSDAYGCFFVMMRKVRAG
ncbi:hypothetical protein [Thioclava dalianensis]|nr:hypothetical protein [Thioclava dalianensis]